MNITIKTKYGEKIEVSLDREELIYGATALITNYRIIENDMAIHPLTKKFIPVIKGNENRLFIPAHIEEDYQYALKNDISIKQVIAPYFLGKDKEALKENVKTEERHSVIAVVKDKIENKYLCLDCKNRDCKSFVMGGIEKGETATEAAIREVKEETGYLNTYVDKIYPIKLYNHFYAGYKGVNRYATLDIVFLGLEDDKKEKISDEEESKHTVKWIEASKLNEFININNNKFVLDVIEKGEHAYTNEFGKMINSSKLDKADILDARESLRRMLNEE